MQRKERLPLYIHSNGAMQKKVRSSDTASHKITNKPIVKDLVPTPTKMIGARANHLTLSNIPIQHNGVIPIVVVSARFQWP